MSAPRCLYAIMTVSVFVASIFVSPILANSDQETASVAIANAEEALILAYEAVLEAEQAGGNITGLLAKLNEAGEFLAAARIFHKTGDFDNATHFANSSKDIGEEAKSAANDLEDLAWNEGMQRVWFTMLGSTFSVILIVLGSLWIWRFLRKHHQ